MPLASDLQQLVQSGVHRIGEIEILRDLHGSPFVICHWQDAQSAAAPGYGGLERHTDPAAARDISTFAEDGAYRFAKGQVNLRRGWVMPLANAEDLRLALDHFYPAAVGIALARHRGALDIQHLRDKLERQTGMYRFARNISDAGAQRLVRTVCGPAHQCAKRILWQIDANTPLEDSEASRFNGIPGDLPEAEAIPLLCREACNHFVAECRKLSKQEFEARTGQ